MSVGRPKTALGDYVSYTEVDDNGCIFYTCKGEGCNHTKKNKATLSFPASQWCFHIVCKCTGCSMEQKVKVAKKSKQKDVKEWHPNCVHDENASVCSVEDNEKQKINAVCCCVSVFSSTPTFVWLRCPCPTVVCLGDSSRHCASVWLRTEIFAETSTT